MAVTISIVGGRRAMISVATGAIALVVYPVTRDDDLHSQIDLSATRTTGRDRGVNGCDTRNGISPRWAIRVICHRDIADHFPLCTHDGDRRPERIADDRQARR